MVDQQRLKMSDRKILSNISFVLELNTSRVMVHGGELVEADDIQRIIADLKGLKYKFVYYKDDYFQELRFFEKGEDFDSRLEICFSIRGTEEMERLYDERAVEEHEKEYGPIDYDEL